MAAASGLGNSSASEGSSRFRPLFLQRVCNSALTVRDKLGFTCVQPTVAGMSPVVLLLLKNLRQLIECFLIVNWTV